MKFFTHGSICFAISYVYLESNGAGGNFEARIMKFIVTKRPLQSSHCIKKRFFCYYHSK